MCLKRCPVCAGWIDPDGNCVECGQPFPEYSLPTVPDAEEDAIAVPIGPVAGRGLAKAIDIQPKPVQKVYQRSILIGPDFNKLLCEEVTTA